MTHRSCLLIAALLPGTAAAELSIHYLDVGQGDATAVTGPGGCTILIDAGRHDRDDVLPHLESLGIDSLDLLIGSIPWICSSAHIPTGTTSDSSIAC